MVARKLGGFIARIIGRRPVAEWTGKNGTLVLKQAPSTDELAATPPGDPREADAD
jgi:hypothetical protein